MNPDELKNIYINQETVKPDAMSSNVLFYLTNSPKYSVFNRIKQRKETNQQLRIIN